MISDEKLNIDLSALDGLSEEEKKIALNILKQYAEDGSSELFEELTNVDFDEIPVDINTFLHDRKYLGNGLYDAEGRFTLFPYWEKVLKDIFPDNLTTKYNNVVLTGCLAYDTEIPLLNGKNIKIGDLAQQNKLDEYVYSYDIETNSYVPGHLVAAFSTGQKPVYNITLDNGTVIKATSNHKFMTRDKHWKSIDTGLTIGDSMMPFNRKFGDVTPGRHGYEIIENPNKNGTTTDIFTHRLVMNWKRGNYKGVVHHKDFNKNNNDPRNLLLTDWFTHKMYHAKRGGDRWREFNKKRNNKEISTEIEQKIQEGALKGCLNRWANEDEHRKMSELTTRRMNDGLAKEMSDTVWKGKNAELNRQIVANNIKAANKDKNRIQQYQISKAIKISNLALLDFGELTETTYEQTKLKYNMRSGYPSFKSILNRISFDELLNQAMAYNHKIIKIEYAGIEEVYDLTVEKYHNFAINNGIIAHNSIGIGKTLVADIILLYMLYRLLCLKDPYTYYGMQTIDKISISFMNITIENAKGVALDKFNQLVLSSEWFMAHGEMAGTTHLRYMPQKHIELIAASSNNQIVGRAIFASFEDEANFSLFSNPEKQKAKMMKIITQVDARMKSRYMRTRKDGTSYLPTINIIASSKDTEQSFLEEYIDNKRRNDSQTTLIVDEPQWVVDSRKDSPIKFWVAIGDKMKANELLPIDAPDTLVDEFRNKGYQMWRVPIGYIDTFQLNLDEAICSIIGIATASSLKYIAGEKLKQTKTDTYRNPFVKDVIEVGNAIDDFVQYSNYFDMSAISEEDKARPLFIHLDMSTGSGGKGDKTGIAGVWITGKASNVHKSIDSGNTEAATQNINVDTSTMDMAYKLAFSVSVKAPKGASISFSKNRNFIRWLREQGFAIKGVSMDTFQSSNIFQDLQADGFKTEIVSVDRVQKDANGHPICLPYHYFKSAIYERRLMIYQKCDLLTDEIIGLERKSDGHIDHTKEGINCLTGDTKISLVDGRELTMLELLDEFNAGKVNYVYTVNENTLKIEPKPIINVFKSGTANKLIKVTLDNGETIQCTPEHKFMLRNGVYCEAKNLLVNDSLMPLYRKYPDELISMHDYRMYYEPIEDKWHYEHRQFANEVLDEKYLVHHKNCIKTDNTPTNLVWCSKALHQKIHSDLETGAQSKIAKEKRSNSLKKWHAENKYDSLDASGKGVWSNRYRKKMYELYNHTVVKIEYINCQEDVYDLTIQDNPNFATTAGIFVHNSKDQCDAVCGATWLASKFSEEYSYSYGDHIATELEINNVLPSQINSNNFSQQVIMSFDEELDKININNLIVDDKNYFQKNIDNKEDNFNTYSDLDNNIIIF